MEVYGAAQARTASYDEFFQANYTTLLKWANQITTQDYHLSQDLVHDVYLRFNESNRKPDDVSSPHAYLYTALRNSYITHLRRRTRSRQVSLLDHESADNASLVVDPRIELRVHDELRAVCEYACKRKETSISASVLILRFFHGYFSAEVARVIKRSRNAVEARLMKARKEACEHLTNVADRTDAKIIRNPSSFFSKELISSRGDLLKELREQVFQSRSGQCLSEDCLRFFYKKEVGALGREELSHLVSCRNCLDSVNTALRLPLLKERHPLDTLGPQTTVEAMQLVKYRTAGA
ncbi:MAG: RNA polymerase sigma factor [Blastocatellia bacterium]